MLLVLVSIIPSMAAAKDYSAPISLAVDHWLAVQKRSGFFPYGFNFLEDKESEPDRMSTANLARQIYAAAVLADYYEISKDSRVRIALERLLTAFRRQSIPIGKGKLQSLVEKAHILSLPFGRYKIQSILKHFGLLFDNTGSGKVPAPDNGYHGAYAGGIALALLTELRYEHFSGDISFADMRQAWLNGLMVLRIPGGGFRQFPTSIEPAPYSDGEAWLALAQYHRLFPKDGRVSEILVDVDQSLLDNYGKDYQDSFYHWGAMAAALRYTDTRETKFLDFIKRQTGAFLDRQRKQQSNLDNNCASIEGAADAQGALLAAGEGGSELAGRLRAWLEKEMTKAEGLQLQPSQTELVYSNAKVEAPRLREFSGSFLASKDKLETQVDYTAHCVSAMIKLQRQSEALAGGN